MGAAQQVMAAQKIAGGGGGGALLTNLISYWKLDEASGNALDAHGSNNLTDNLSVGAASGKILGARDFERGTDNYFDIASNASLVTGDIDFTVSAWVNLESKGVDFSQIVGKWAGGTSKEWQLAHDAPNDRFVFITYNGGFPLIRANNLGAPSLATWYHVVAWHDSINNEIGISVNAGTPDTTASSGGVATSAASFSMGNDAAGGENWDGLIDEVGFWKRVLTSQERTDLYNGGSGLPYSSF